MEPRDRGIKGEHDRRSARLMKGNGAQPPWVGPTATPCSVRVVDARTGDGLERKLSLAHLERHPLPLSQLLQRIAAALAAEPAVLHAAEGHMRLVGDGAVVHMHHSGLKPERETERFLHAVGEEPGRVTIR